MKNNGCVGCHQLGTLSTRTIPAFFGKSLQGSLDEAHPAGQAGELMVNIMPDQLGAAPIAYLTDWTDRIAKGELPATKPQRPQGLERNIVVTTWDWSDEKHYLHDLISTDRRNPTVNARRSGLRPARIQHGLHPDRSIRRPTPRPRSRRRSATRTCTRISVRAMPPMERHSARRPTGATRRSGRPTSTTTTRCSTRRAGSG